MAVVLIIDDSPTELHLFQSMLENAGFNTLVADSGEKVSGRRSRRGPIAYSWTSSCRA